MGSRIVAARIHIIYAPKAVLRAAIFHTRKIYSDLPVGIFFDDVFIRIFNVQNITCYTVMQQSL